jgi:ribose 5-phosphate isomerase B
MNTSMKIAIGADHGGFAQKEILKDWLLGQGYDVFDAGTSNDLTAVDYPNFAHAVADEIASDAAAFGVLVCGTGLGMAIAANKVPGIRAVTVTTVDFARLAREHNDANVLCLSGRFVDEDLNKEIMATFLATDFEGGRHERRVAKFERS